MSFWQSAIVVHVKTQTSKGNEKPNHTRVQKDRKKEPNRQTVICDWCCCSVNATENVEDKKHIPKTQKLIIYVFYLFVNPLKFHLNLSSLTTYKYIQNKLFWVCTVHKPRLRVFTYFTILDHRTVGFILLKMWAVSPLMKSSYQLNVDFEALTNQKWKKKHEQTKNSNCTTPATIHPPTRAYIAPKSKRIIALAIVLHLQQRTHIRTKWSFVREKEKWRNICCLLFGVVAFFVLLWKVVKMSI